MAQLTACSTHKPNIVLIYADDLGIESIEIIDFTGRTINFSGTLTIDMSNFTKGIYFVKIETMDGIITNKIVLQ